MPSDGLDQSELRGLIYHLHDDYDMRFAEIATCHPFDSERVRQLYREYRGPILTDGCVDQPDPTADTAACSMCGCHIGYGGSDAYCDGCARDVGAKPPMRTCRGCGQTGQEEQMEAVDVSPEDEYYPDIQYLCRSCGGGD